jgi:hypothetical protein
MYIYIYIYIPFCYFTSLKIPTTSQLVSTSAQVLNETFVRMEMLFVFYFLFFSSLSFLFSQQQQTRVAFELMQIVWGFFCICWRLYLTWREIKSYETWVHLYEPAIPFGWHHGWSPDELFRVFFTILFLLFFFQDLSLLFCFPCFFLSPQLSISFWLVTINCNWERNAPVARDQRESISLHVKIVRLETNHPGKKERTC